MRTVKSILGLLALALLILSVGLSFDKSLPTAAAVAAAFFGGLSALSLAYLVKVLK